MEIRDNKQVIDSNRSSFQFESVFEVYEIKLSKFLTSYMICDGTFMFQEYKEFGDDFFS